MIYLIINLGLGSFNLWTPCSLFTNFSLGNPDHVMFNALFNQVVDKEWNRFSFALYFYMNMVKYYPIQFNVKLCVCVCVCVCV